MSHEIINEGEEFADPEGQTQDDPSDVNPDLEKQADDNLDCTQDFEMGPADLKLGLVFPNKKTAEKALRHWCDFNFCPLAKVNLLRKLLYI